jgi:chromosome segregation ATPase
MTFSSNTAQARDLSEVRNHLKWLDDERRKTAKKMTELEQRLAQQGRELAEREQRIQELEWQLGQVTERIDRLPEVDTGASGHEQRLQDLEWHLSNINAQLVRLPKVDDDLNVLRSRLDQLPSYDTSVFDAGLATLEVNTRAQIESLDQNLAELEQALRVQEAAYDQLSRTNMAVVDDRLVTLETQLQTRFAALEDQRATLEAQLQTRFAALEDQSATLETQLQTRFTALEDQSATLVQETQSKLLADVADLRARLDAIPNFDAKLAAFQEEVTKATADYEARTALAQEEARQQLQAFMDSAQFPIAFERIERLEETLSALPAIREAVTNFGRLEQDLEFRQAEEVRLGNLISVQDAKFTPLLIAVDTLKQDLADLEKRAAGAEAAVQEVRTALSDLDDNWKPGLLETRNRLTPISERLTALNSSVPRLEAALESVSGDQANLREALTGLADHVSANQLEVTRQIEAWQAVQDEQKDTIERFTQQWLTLSNQYKEARMAVQNFAHWQKQLEQQKREATELVRVESNRLQSRWEGFLLEFQETLKNSELDLAQKWQSFEMDNEQRWAAVRRTEQQWRDELAAIDDLILKLQQDNRNLIWRVQAAQADAIKKWPRLLLEEVEKAVELNPQRRLQPATGPVSRADLSVADAIEQGLIKVDYDDAKDSA